VKVFSLVGFSSTAVVGVFSCPDYGVDDDPEQETQLQPQPDS
jgi:hypothetical protein